ncbi:MAG: hypothetical protein PUG16_04580 [Lachnospiraceae bacterium]|jgi:hypothetical protein|nr:hypothetical protein [Lachnospiraceae bacterium]
MWDKLERKFGKYAIRHLMNYLIGGYILGYFFVLGQQILKVPYLSYMTLDPYQIIHGTPIPQIWRLITWVLIPPFGSGFINFIFGVIMMIFYWQLGTVLERTWGTFRFNVFIWSGILFTVIGSFILYAVYAAQGYPAVALSTMMAMQASVISTNYINLSIFLAFALCYPDMQVMLYFIIPIRMKWLSIVYVIFTVIDLIRFISSGYFSGVVEIAASFLSFIIFYHSTRDNYHVSFRQAKRRRNFQRATRNFKDGFGPSGQDQGPKPRHKCCICGRTDISNPELTFRYCSKCNGNYEYCQDHLFTHTHVK